MINAEYIKVGQKFKGEVEDSILEITEITINYLGKTYIALQDKKGYISSTNLKHFTHLLFTPIK